MSSDIFHSLIYKSAMEHNIRIFTKVVYYFKSKNSRLKQIYSKTDRQEKTTVKTDTQNLRSKLRMVQSREKLVQQLSKSIL
jgi:hypothetical protein